MSKLGAKPFMISALGLDMAGDLLTFFLFDVTIMVFQSQYKTCRSRPEPEVVKTHDNYLDAL